MEIKVDTCQLCQTWAYSAEQTDKIKLFSQKIKHKKHFIILTFMLKKHTAAYKYKYNV